MNKFGVFIIGVSLLFASDWTPYLPQAQIEVENLARESKGVVVGLGRSCAVAEGLMRNGIRRYSFPFDWNLTSFEALCRALENDFQDFFNFECFSKGYGWGPMQKQYEIHFPHEGISVDDCNEGPSGLVPKNQTVFEQYQKRRETYCRRIARFNVLLNSDIPVYFIRFGEINSERAVQLYDLLKVKFPNGKWMLVCLEDRYSGKEKSWEKPGLAFFKMSQEFDDRYTEFLDLICREWLIPKMNMEQFK